MCYGLQPSIVASRKSRMTYGVAIVRRFERGRDPESKLAVRDNVEWCTDVFDVLVRAGDSVGLDDPVVRSYAPVGRRTGVFTVYAADTSNGRPVPRFVTDPGVSRCGALRLELDPADQPSPSSSASSSGAAPAVTPSRPREIRARMTFGDTEVKVVAVDVVTGKSVRATFDFMSTGEKKKK